MGLPQQRHLRHFPNGLAAKSLHSERRGAIAHSSQAHHFCLFPVGFGFAIVNFCAFMVIFLL